MSSAAPSDRLSGHDFELIESAVKETERGRWFLDEYARRNRQADTERVLAAIARLEGAVLHPDAVAAGLCEELRTVGRVLSELCSNGALSGSFSSGVETGTNASALGIAEQLQDLGWMLRTRGGLSRDCDLIDKGASELFAATARLDHAARREALVVDILKAVEANIATVLDRFAPAEPSALASPPAPLDEPAPEETAAAQPPAPMPPDPTPARVLPLPESPLAAYDRLEVSERLRRFH